MSVMHFANALVWEIIGPAMAGPTGPCATRYVVGLVERDLISRSWCVRLSVRHMLVKINQTNHVVFTSW